jgi:hypothetical protein
MATTKITVTLPDDQIHSIRELVAAGKADRVSAFFRHAVAVGLFDAAGWRAMLNEPIAGRSFCWPAPRSLAYALSFHVRRCLRPFATLPGRHAFPS